MISMIEMIKKGWCSKEYVQNNTWTQQELNA